MSNFLCFLRHFNPVFVRQGMHGQTDKNVKMTLQINQVDFLLEKMFLSDSAHQKSNHMGIQAWLPPSWVTRCMLLLICLQLPTAGRAFRRTWLGAFVNLK